MNRILALSMLLANLLLLASDRPLLSQDTSERNMALPRQPIPVQLQQTGGGWQILRGNDPYYVNGAGGLGSVELLKSIGGNSIRLWGVDQASEAKLNEAADKGISVALGLWLEHERHGFSYADPKQTAEQFEKTLAAVKQYKDHPAVLLWGIGNEMEGDGSNPLVWKHIEELASAIKKIDPLHPTMTVIAGMGGDKVPSIHRLCPHIDIIGINSYGGAPSVPQRYRQLGGTKPYLVTEFGPRGPWELTKNNIGAVLEETSTVKAETYRQSATSIRDDRELCLGFYVFLWGHKQEATATWFGMLLPDGKRTAAVDVMQEIWTGKPPTKPCPRINSLTLQGDNEVEPNAIVKLVLNANDPAAQKLHANWVLMAEANAYITGGDFQEAPPTYENNVIESGLNGASLKMPDQPGLYRVYAYVDDGDTGAAVANLPIRVKGAQLEWGQPVKIPFILYDEPQPAAVFAPTGWMGNTAAIQVDERSTTNPKFGQFCIECKYLANDNWGGVVWQSPPEDWGDKPGGVDLSGAKKLTFWARSDNGGEEIKFGFGLLGREKPYYDTAKDEITVRLTDQWKQFSFDIQEADLRRIKSGFYWSIAGQNRPSTFYLDRIMFE